jgi:hypothetical protein
LNMLGTLDFYRKSDTNGFASIVHERIACRDRLVGAGRSDKDTMTYTHLSGRRT